MSKYIRQLEIFSQLRNLQDTVYQKKSAMDFVYDIEKDPVYKEGERRGEKRGEERGEKRGEERGKKRGEIQGEKKKTLVIAQAMKQAGEPTEKIIAYTQLSHEEIEKL